MGKNGYGVQALENRMKGKAPHILAPPPRT